MHKTPPNIPANLYQAFITNRMIETPIRFVRGVLGYKSDPAVRMDDFEEYLELGETAADFTLETMSGEEWTLSAHRGEYVVLEFGSYTCPTYRRQITGMARLARRFSDADVTFALVYQKEAHPNQGQFLSIDDPATFEAQKQLADRLATEEDVPMTILLDDVPRNVSATYGGAPNMLYIVSPDGEIAFKSLWTNPPALESYLERNLANVKR